MERREFYGKRPGRGAGPEKADGRPHHGDHHRRADHIFDFVYSLSAGDSAGGQFCGRRRLRLRHLQADLRHAQLYPRHRQYPEDRLRGGHPVCFGWPALRLCGGLRPHEQVCGRTVQGGLHAAGGIAAFRAEPFHDHALRQGRPRHPVFAWHLRQQRLRLLGHRGSPDADLLPGVLHDAQGPAEEHRSLSGRGGPGHGSQPLAGLYGRDIASAAARHRQRLPCDLYRVHCGLCKPHDHRRLL